MESFLQLKQKFHAMSYQVLLLVFCFQFIILSNSFSQKIFSCESKYDSDFSVFVTDSKYDADLLVFKVESKYDADGNKGFWHFVESKYDADKKIYFEESKYNADLLIYFVESKYDAKWRKQEKIYLLY